MIRHQLELKSPKPRFGEGGQCGADVGSLRDGSRQRRVSAEVGRSPSQRLGADHGSAFSQLYHLSSRHPSASHVFVPLPLERDRAPIFDDLHPYTPMVFVNFGPADDIHLRVPTDGSRHLSYFRAIDGLTPSIFIISPAIDKGNRCGHFVVPSTELTGEDRQILYDNIVDTSLAKGVRKFGFLTLASGSMLDTYRASSSDGIVHSLTAVVDAFQQGRDLYYGRQGTTGGVIIHPVDFVVTKTRVMDQWIDYHSGEVDQIVRKGRHAKSRIT